jgi:thioredoxin reductase (NADPH)
MTTDTDVVIIGAGPCGLFQVFELGLLDLRAHVIDALPKVGGQCVELYPDKPIYDIPGYPVVGAQQLIDNLMEQIQPFHPAFHLNQQVAQVQVLDEQHFSVRTSAETEFRTKSVVIAGGVGAFQPVLLRVNGIEPFHDRQVFYRVVNPEAHAGKKVVVLGGGDSALDWALQMHARGSHVTLIHRSSAFKAAPASVAKFKELTEGPRAQLLFGSVVGLQSEADRLTGLEVACVDQTRTTVAVDDLLVFYGLSPKLGPIAEWGLNLNKHQIEVDTERFETSTPGIYAVGDINFYAGKKKLILSGFHEAALAAFAIKHRISPNEKIHLQYTTTSPSVHKKLGVDGASLEHHAAG